MGICPHPRLIVLGRRAGERAALRAGMASAMAGRIVFVAGTPTCASLRTRRVTTTRVMSGQGNPRIDIDANRHPAQPPVLANRCKCPFRRCQSPATVCAMAHDVQLIFASGAVAAAGLATRLRLLAGPIVSTVATVRPDFGRPERALLGWAKLSGAVPVIRASLAVIEGVQRGIEHLGIAFFGVLVWAGIQGPTVHPLAARIWSGEREHRSSLVRSPKAELEVS